MVLVVELRVLFVSGPGPSKYAKNVAWRLFLVAMGNGFAYLLGCRELPSM